MSTKINVQIDATPELIRQHLQEHLAAFPVVPREPHPFEAGQFARFTDDLAQALSVNPENPVLIKEANPASPTLAVLFLNAGGDIQEHNFSANQLMSNAAEEPAEETHNGTGTIQAQSGE